MRRIMLYFLRGGRRGLSDTLGVLSDVGPPSRGRGSAAGDRGRGPGRVPLCPVVRGGHVAVGRVLCPVACPVQWNLPVVAIAVAVFVAGGVVDVIPVAALATLLVYVLLLQQ